MKAKTLYLSVVVAQGLWAMNVDKEKFYTRDYLDFGQNLGQFTPGAKNLTIIGKDGQAIDLPDLPFPDFSKFDGANRTSVGGAYTASSWHVVRSKKNNGTIYSNKNIKIGDSTYADTDNVKVYGKDSAYTRVNKFIVEGGYKVTSFSDLKNNAQDYITHYKDEDRIVLYRSGNGRMGFDHWRAYDPKDSVKSSTRAGNLFYIKPDDINNNEELVVKLDDHHYGPLRGDPLTGDSGSPMFAFNKKTQEWEIVGTVWGGYKDDQDHTKSKSASWGVVDPQQLDSFKKQFEITKVADGGWYQTDKNKDSVYGDSGTIIIDSEIDQGIGGIILRGVGKTLAIVGNGSFSGAGIDVDDKDSKVLWDTGVKGDLHKIGKGTLEVTKQTNGNLRMGEGRVVLKVTNSFNSAYLGNGDGELVLGAENAVKDFNVSFGKSGGTVDLNGFNVSTNAIKAYNGAASITNKNEGQASTLTLTNTDKTMIHAHISGNTTIQAQSGINNANVNVGEENKTGGNSETRAIVFDGGFAIRDLNGSGQHIVLQGKPVAHATWEGGCTNPPPIPVFWFPKECKVGHYIDKYDKQKATEMNQSHKVDNRTVFFEQPDWLQKEYSGNIRLDNDSKLFIEKNADVKANIALDHSTLEFNSKMLYIDKNDSKSLNQNIENKSLTTDPKDTITYRGDLIALNNSKIESKNGIKSFEASVYLDKSSLNAPNDDIKLLAGGLTLRNGAKFSAKSLHIAGVDSSIWVDKDSSVSVDSISIKDSPFTAFYTAKGDLGSSAIPATSTTQDAINVINSTLYISRGSAIPSLDLQSGSKLWLEVMDSSTDLKNVKFHDNGFLMSQVLSHAQGQPIVWANSNGIKSLTITDTLRLSNVGDAGSTSNTHTSGDDNRFLALNLQDMGLFFAQNSRVSVEFANSHDELFSDSTLNHDGTKLYPMVKAKSLETEGDLIVSFAGQTSLSKRQAIAKHTSTGIDIGFTDINQVDPGRILGDMLTTIPSIKEMDSKQQALLDDMLVANKDHRLVLDVAFNKNSRAAVSQLLQGIQRIDSSAKEITKTLSQDANLALMNEHHNTITNRINTLRLSRTDAPLTQAHRLAALKSDVLNMSITKAALRDIRRNNAWINAGGGYFTGNGKLAYASTNMGYDRSIGIGEKSAVVGGLLSFGASFGSNSAYSDNAMNYGAGLYSAFKLKAQEMQLDTSYVASFSQKSAQNVSAVKSMNNSVGLNAVYKYAFEIGKSNAIKPVLGLEYVANMVAGYTLDLLKVNGYNYYALSGLAGLEYAYTNQSFFFSIRGAGKRSLLRAKDDLQVGINGANRFIGYALQGDEMVYKLDCMGDYKIGALALGSALNFQAMMNGWMGISGLVKVEYRF